MTMTDRVLILGELRGLAASPLWDAPKALDDSFRRAAMCRAEAIICGCHVFGVPLIWHDGMPHAILNGEPVPLYKHRTQHEEWR